MEKTKEDATVHSPTSVPGQQPKSEAPKDSTQDKGATVQSPTSIPGQQPKSEAPKDSTQDKGATVQSPTSIPGQQPKSEAPKDSTQDKGATVQSPTSIPGQQPKSEAPKDSTQGGITPAQYRPVLCHFKIASKMSTPAASTSSNADTSTLTIREPNLTGKTMSASGDDTNDNMPSSGMTSQEQTQNTSPKSGAIADSDTKNDVTENTEFWHDTNDNMPSSGMTSQEQTQNTSPKSRGIADSGTKNDVTENTEFWHDTNDNMPSSGMTSQEQTQTTSPKSRAIADSGTKNDVTENTEFWHDTNDNMLSSGMTSQEQTQTTSPKSGAIADSDTKNDVTESTEFWYDNNDNMPSSGMTSQEQTQTTSPKFGAIADSHTKNNVIEITDEVNSSTSVGSAGSSDGSDISHDPELQSFTILDSIHLGYEVIRSMAIVGANNILLTGTDNTTVREWHKGKQFSQFDSTMLSRGPVYAIDLQCIHRSDSGSTDISIFLAHDRGEIGVWVISDSDPDPVPRPVWTLRRLRDQLLNSVCWPWRDPLANRITCLCVSEERDIIYTGSADCTLNIWQSQEFHFNPVETIQAHEGEIKALAVGRTMVFSGSIDGVIKMWKREANGRNNEKVRHNLVGTVSIQDQVRMLPASVNALAFQKVGHAQSGYLYAGSSDGKVRCWTNLSVGDPEVMSFHEGEVTCLALCSGPLVFSGSTDGSICVWRRENEAVNQIAVVNHTIATVLRGHSQRVTCIKAHDDWEATNAAPGNRQWILYSGSHDHTLKIWRVYEQPQN